MYAEDVMADAGFLDGDPLYVITHLKVRLRAISNAIHQNMDRLSLTLPGVS